MRIAIIGAGASGMAAALQAAWNGASVTLFERNAMGGRKLLVTGAGRCNITNNGVCAAKYTCADSAWMDSLLHVFGVPELIEMLQKIGIPVHSTSDGWYYPLSNSAQNVADSFSHALLHANVTLRLSSPVTTFSVQQDGFRIQWTEEKDKRQDEFEKVIVAAGGKAYPSLGSRGELFPILQQMGHTLLPKRPALAPVLADLKRWSALQGVKLDVGASLWDGKHPMASAAGNLIFTEWGLNGPAVMDISHHVSAHPSEPLTLSLNLLHFFETEFQDLLLQKRSSSVPIKIFLGAFLPPKVTMLYPKLIPISENAPLNQLDDATLSQLIEKLKDSRFRVKGVRGFEFCQLSAGGVPVTEVNPSTLESRIKQNFYLTGETLDVVGPCGGYNLHFAFASGALAGMAAARQF